jgi:hypothetical protein
MGLRSLLSELLPGDVFSDAPAKQRNAVGVGSLRVARGAEQSRPCSAPKARYPRRWQRDTSSLRLLSAAIALVDAEPELAELGPDGLAVAWRIFRPGWNTSRNGPVLFDEIAAGLVMADYREHGARIQVDMDHVSLNKESAAYDPRGLGYHDLELRDDGSLWACRAVWTKRGAECLESDPDSGRAAELPYYSPAFDTDTDLQFGDEPDRVTYIFNGGLVGTPATDRPMALAKAASRHKGQLSMDPKLALKAFRAMTAGTRRRVNAFMSLSETQRELPPAKLVEQLHAWQAEGGDDIDPKVLQKIVSQIPGADSSAGIGGLLRQLRAFVKAVEKALLGEEPMPEAVPTEPETMADNPGDTPEPELMATQRKQAEELRQLRRDADERDKEIKKLKAEREAKELAKRCELVAQLVVMDRETPPTAWVDPSADVLQPRGSLATMPLDELEDRVREFSAAPNLPFGTAPQPASGYSGAVTQPGLFEVSADEEKKLKALARKNGRDPEKAWQRYLDQRTVVCTSATGPVRRIVGRRYSGDYRHPDAKRWNIVLPDSASELERYRTWATQAPVEGHSAVSIAAMRTFDERYNMLVAASRVQWVETVGEMKPGGTIGDETYPLDFEELFWELKTAQGPGLETPQTWSIDVRKKRYTVGATANLEMLETPGSFDYLQSTWLAKADKMARAKDRKIAQLAMAILKAPGAWLYERFLDGKLERMTDKRMFAVDHPINPRKPEVTDINGATTWSNYQTAATQFEPSALTVEKALFNLVPNMAGEFLSMPASHVLSPTSLYEEVNNKLTIQDRILALANVGGTDVEGQVTSPHVGQGMTPFEIPEMEGVDVTADWMLFSEERKAAGYVPFLVCVGTERVKMYGPDSDFAKDTDHIKEVREVDLRAVPIRPEAVRWIVGS